MYFEDGEVIVKQGDEGDCMYIIDDGNAYAEINGKKVMEYNKGQVSIFVATQLDLRISGWMFPTVFWRISAESQATARCNCESKWKHHRTSIGHT